jgi:hypothetical protein
MGLVVNKLLLAYKNKPNFLEDIVLNAKPSLLSILNFIKKVAIDKGYASPEQLTKNTEEYVQSRKDSGVEVTGNILSQYGFGSTSKPGAYDRYTPFRNNPDADFLVTGMPFGTVQASCNPFKESRSLKGINLGEIKDQVLLDFKSELEKQILPFRTIKRIAEKEATKDSVGFTSRDMMALYGSMPSYNPETQSINGYDFLVANSGGHKCITNISGINFMYSGYDKPYTKDLPKESIPIAFYEGQNTFIKDIKQKLLRFRKLSEKQIQSAISGMKREGIDTESLMNQKQERGYLDLVKEIKDRFVDILNEMMGSKNENITENHNKKDVMSLLKKHIKKEKTLNENDWSYIIRKVDGVIDNKGQWEHPGKCTMIESNTITMKNVNYPLVGIDNTGHMKFMLPNMNYKFPGEKVFEIPCMGKHKNLAIELLRL